MIKGTLGMIYCLLLFFVPETRKLQDDEEEDCKLCYCPWIGWCGFCQEDYNADDQYNACDDNSEVDEVTHRCEVKGL